MAPIVTMIIKTVFTEKVMKKILCILGDYLVKSTKNKLDDVMWAKVKKTLNV